MVLAVSGNVKTREVLAQAQRLFGAMPAGAAAVADPAGAAALAATREVFKVPGAQAQIFMAGSRRR